MIDDTRQPANFRLPQCAEGYTRHCQQHSNFSHIDFHVVTDEPWETANIYTNHEDALKKAFFHKVLHKIFDNLEGENFSKLTRVDDVPIDTGVICYNILRYTTNLYEADPIGSDTILVGDDATVQLKGKLVKQLK